MKKIGMLFWVFGFALLLGGLNANSAEISEGMNLYTRTNLTTKGKKIYYHNLRSSKGFIPVGTAVEVREVGEQKIKFVVLDTGMEYSLEAPSVDFEKYFVKTKDELRPHDMSQETVKEIENMNVKVGMTKAEVYISRGCPSYIGFGKKSWFYTFDQVMDSNIWYYNVTRRGIENIVRFKDGVVAAIEEPDISVYREKTEPYEEKVEVAVTTPEPAELGTVRIGVLSDRKGYYLRHLRDEIGKKPNREVLRFLESKSYFNLDIEMARILGQRYQIDMLIGVTARWRSGHGYRGYTKLIDISAQRLVELKPVPIGYMSLSPGWEKKLVRNQIGAIDKMVKEISREKRKSKH